MGHVPFLKRRLTAIMRGEAHKTMSGRELLGLILAAAALLPWHPGLTPAVARTTSSPAHTAITEFTSTEAMQIVADTRKSAAEPLDWTDPLTTAVEKAIDPSPAAAEDRSWAAAQSPDGRYVIARSGRDNKISLYDAKTQESIDLSEYRILSVAFSPDGTKFVTGGSDRVVRLWASSTGEDLAQFRGHHGPVQAVVFMRDGETVISASRDGSIKIWDLALRDAVRHVESPSRPVNCLAISPDGSSLALGTGSWIRFEEGGRVIVLDLATFKERAVLPPCDRPVGAVAFKSDSNTLVSGDWQGQVTFWDVARNKRLGITLAQYKDKITEAQFSPDSGALSSIGLDSILPEPAYNVPLPIELRNLFDQSASLDLGRRETRDATDEIPNFNRERRR